MERRVFIEEGLYRLKSPGGILPEVQPFPMAARIPDLSDKVVYCVSQVVMGADIFLQKVAKALPDYIPGVKTLFKRKPAAYMTDDPEIWNEIESKADAVIYGCGA